MSAMSADTAGHEPSAMDPFIHPALFYLGVDDYVTATMSFIREGLAAGEPVAVAVPGPNLRLLRSALGASTGKVRLLDMAKVGRNPGRIIPGVLREFADAHQGGRVRIVGEPVWAGRGEAEYLACAQHEALINMAFAGRPVTILCPYDAGRLDPVVLADVTVTHPVLIDGNGRRESGGYAPERIVDLCNRPLPRPRQTTAIAYDAVNLNDVRHTVVEHAGRAGLPAERILDAELAVNELAVNTLKYGGGSGTLRIWTQDDHFICEVVDAGHITDPLVGRRPVDPGTPGGRGILMVNHLADLVCIHSRPKCTTIRVHFALSAGAPW